MMGNTVNLQPLIQGIIPIQNFELVRDRIGAVLFTELRNQEILRNVSNENYTEVFVERITPYSDEEGVMINVMFDGSNYKSFTQSNAQGDTRYYIDVYGSGKARVNSPGGFVSASKTHCYLGMIRYILQSTFYNKLLFPYGFIGGLFVENIQMSDPQGSQDASFGTMGRVTVRLDLCEDQELYKGVEYSSFQTTVLLEETKKGYKYIKNTI